MTVCGKAPLAFEVCLRRKDTAASRRKHCRFAAKRLTSRMVGELAGSRGLSASKADQVLAQSRFAGAVNGGSVGR
jgi:hypothetical protein